MVKLTIIFVSHHPSLANANIITTSLLLIILHLALTPSAHAELFVWYYNCSTMDGYYTTTSTYKTNLDILFNKTTTNLGFGFYNLSTGQYSPDAANLISLCLGNVSSCHTCQNHVINRMKILCPNQRTAIAWSDDCFVRYSNRSMFRALEEDPMKVLMNMKNPPNDTVEKDIYINVAKTLLDSLPKSASSGDSRLKFAAAQANYNSAGNVTVTMYAVAQCTPDLTQRDCFECLSKANAQIQSCPSCQGRKGARVLLPSCMVRFEDRNFYLPSPMTPNTTNVAPSANSPVHIPSTSMGGKGYNKRRKIIVVVVAGGGLCLILVVVASFMFTRKRKLYPNLDTSMLIDGDDISNIKSLQFKFSTTRAATGNFSEANKLGQGGFGAVYKGTLPNSGQEIAVKRLAGNSKQGEEEFKTEIRLLAKLQHRNLVRLLGFCFHNDERLLIYEFVPNASLDHFLFGATRRAHLDWETRYKIIRGIARGILYLQEDSRLRIIHRDLKAGNVLLDAEMCPKIADFGTARLFDIHQTHSETRRIVGTYGYMAPEYALHGNFSTKSDVYSFGILILEIVCGKRCSALLSGETLGCLIGMVWTKWSEGIPLEVVESAITDGSESEILKCIHIGLLCVQDNMADRPTMSSIVRMMNSESVALPTPLQPAYLMTSNLQDINFSQDIWSSDKSTGLESITELHAR